MYVLEAAIVLMCILQVFLKNMRQVFFLLFFSTLLVGVWIAEKGQVEMGMLLAVVAGAISLSSLFLVAANGHKEERHDVIRAAFSSLAAAGFVFMVYHLGIRVDPISTENTIDLGLKEIDSVAFIFERFYYELVVLSIIFLLIAFGVSHVLAIKDEVDRS